MKRQKGNIPLKAKICTAIAWTMLIGVVSFSVYAQMPVCQIASIDNPLWGILSLIILAIAVGVFYWGYKPDKPTK